MSILVKDKGFYRTLAVIALPIAGQNLINFAVSMADTVMLGMLGEIQLSAAANANQLGFIFTLFTFGLGSGSNVMIAQYWGKGELEPIHKVLTVMYRGCFAVGVLFSAIAFLLPEQFMSIFTTNREVIAEGVGFLRILGYSYLLAGITSATVFVLRAVSSVNISLVIYLSSLATNVVMNYALIFGRLGFPAMGVRGAAIATCVARGVEFIILIVYLVKFEHKLCYKFRMLFMRRLGILRQYLKTALPVIFNELLWGSGTAMVAVIIGRMGTEFTAANSVCTVLSQLVMIANYGVGNAAGVIVGNRIGQGRAEDIPQYARTFTVLALLLGCISSCFVMVFKGPLLSLYNISDLAKLYAGQIMTIYSGVVIFQALAMVLLIGVLRGGGDTRFVLLGDVVFLWCISIPLGFLTGLHLGWPVWAVYIIIKSDEFFKTIAAFWRIGRGGWINDITKN